MNEAPAMDPHEAKLLGDGEITLFRDPGVLSEAIGSLRRRGYEIADVRCDPFDRFVADCAKSLRWKAQLGYEPHAERFGLDAFDDALHDFHGSATTAAFVMRDFDALVRRDERFARNVLETLWDHGRTAERKGRRVACFVQTRKKRLTLRHLPDRYLRWNPGEGVS